LRIDPYLPQAIGQLDLTSIPGRWGRTDASADAAASLVGALEAAAKQAPSAVRELFATLDRADMPAAKAGSDVRASVGFRLADSGDWLVELDAGKIRVREGFETADCVLEMSDATLMDILKGDQNARTALMAGKVKVSGDFGIASKFGRIVAKAA
jgi:putative sterol carrier protein